MMIRPRTIEPRPIERLDPACVRIDAAVAVRRRSRLVAGLLGVLLGAFGAHRWYLGYRRAAIVQLVLTICTGGVAGLWGVAEGWLILLGLFGCDAQGHPLAQATAGHVASAALGSLSLHAGTVLGAWLMHSSAPWLIPPPSGINSIAISPAPDVSEATPLDVKVTPPKEPELPASEPPTNAVDDLLDDPPPQRPHVAPPFDASPMVDSRLTADAGTTGEGEQQPAAGPALRVSSDAHRAAVQRTPPLLAERPPAPDAVAMARPVRRLAADAAPSTSQPPTVSLPLPASRENSGFDTDSLPARLESPRPVYPPELEQRGITGLVKLRVRVGADGRVKSATVYQSSGYRGFDRAALDVIDRWRFEPARRAGVAVEMEIAVPIRFVIEQDSAANTPTKKNP